MSKPLRILLALLLVGVSCLTVAVAHTPPAPEVPPEPVPSRSLFMVVNNSEAAEEDSSDYPDDLNLAFSPVADAAAERSSYYWSDNNLGPICFSSFCRFYGAEGMLSNVGEDFRLTQADTIFGVLDLEYYYSENSFTGSRKEIGAIHFGLNIGSAFFEAQPIVLERDGMYEPTLHNLTFHFAATCDTESHDENGEHPPCDESFENWTEEVWTHDVTLSMYLQIPPRNSLSFGRHFDMSIGTNGTSKLELPIYVPSAPVALAMDDSATVTIAHDDVDADGEVAEPVAVGDDVVYVPGIGAPLLAGATVGLAVLVRRRV